MLPLFLLNEYPRLACICTITASVDECAPACMQGKQYPAVRFTGVGMYACSSVDMDVVQHCERNVTLCVYECVCGRVIVDVVVGWCCRCHEHGCEYVGVRMCVCGYSRHPQHKTSPKPRTYWWSVPPRDTYMRCKYHWHGYQLHQHSPFILYVRCLCMIVDYI